MAIRTSNGSVSDAVQDRQRDRTARGVGGRAAPAAAACGGSSVSS
ncbi:hypothetical protein [Aeromicrobium sp.]|nr:hypothetical protein [Aeromicrobium sp.]